MFVYSCRSYGILSSHNCMNYKNNNMYNKTFKDENLAVFVKLCDLVMMPSSLYNTETKMWKLCFNKQYS